jgi:hypothetical protein
MPESSPVGVPLLAIQIVSVTWTKLSRGGSAAALRNRIPRAFLLHRHGKSFNVVQRHDYAEVSSGEFDCTSFSSGQAPTPPTDVEGLLLERRQDGSLSIGFAWNGNVHGMPKRERKGKILVMFPGEVAQLHINGRHSAGKQWYTQHTYNVALGPDLHENVFIERPFEKRISLEEHLF